MPTGSERPAPPQARPRLVHPLSRPLPTFSLEAPHHPDCEQGQVFMPSLGPAPRLMHRRPQQFLLKSREGKAPGSPRPKKGPGTGAEEAGQMGQPRPGGPPGSKGSAAGLKEGHSGLRDTESTQAGTAVETAQGPAVTPEKDFLCSRHLRVLNWEVVITVPALCSFQGPWGVTVTTTPMKTKFKVTEHYQRQHAPCPARCRYNCN